MSEREQELLEMVKRLAAGWDRERHIEFGSEISFPTQEEWNHWDMVPEVQEFLKNYEAH